MDRVVNGGVPGHQDDRAVGVQLDGSLENGHPALAGHANVGDDDVGLLTLEEVDGRAGIGGAKNLVPGFLEGITQGHEDGDLVLGEKDPHQPPWAPGS